MPKYKECNVDVVETIILQPKGHHSLFKKKVLSKTYFCICSVKREAKPVHSNLLWSYLIMSVFV